MRSLLIGVSLGWAAGISPGPLMIFVISTSLKKGARAGMRVALAPFLTDTPMLIVSVIATSRVGDDALDVLTLIGAVYLVWLGVVELRQAGYDRVLDGQGGGDLRRAIWLNLTSPHPWIFWLTVGGPIVARADSTAVAVGFLVGFYALLVGTKLMTAFLVGSNAHRFSDQIYRTMVKTGAIALIGFGLFLAWDRFLIG